MVGFPASHASFQGEKTPFLFAFLGLVVADIFGHCGTLTQPI